MRDSRFAFGRGDDKCVQLRDRTKGKPDIIVVTPAAIGDIVNSEPNIAKALKTTRTVSLTYLHVHIIDGEYAVDT